MRRRPSEHYVVERILAGAGATDPEALDRLRDRMYADVDDFALACGYQITELAWESFPERPFALRLRLDATIVPLTTGVWPGVRRAVEEDQLALQQLRKAQEAPAPRREPPPTDWLRGPHSPRGAFTAPTWSPTATVDGSPGA